MCFCKRFRNKHGSFEQVSVFMILYNHGQKVTDIPSFEGSPANQYAGSTVPSASQDVYTCTKNTVFMPFII